MALGDSVNPYLAARAVFLLMRSNPHLERVASPGFGTGVGRIGANTCAHQVRAALDEILLGKATPPNTWAEASERHQMLYTAHPRRLQH